MIIERGIATSPLEILLELSSGRFMQGNEAAFAEFGTSNHQPIRGEVLITQVDRFRHAKPRACEQCEERAVGRSTQGTLPRLGDRLHEALDVMPGEDVRDRPASILAAKDSWRQFMAWVLGTHRACEPNDVAQPARTLSNRSC